MHLSNEEYSTVKTLLLHYWHGTRESKRFTITDGVTLTVDHTENDEVRFTVSVTDLTEYCTQKPNTLSEIEVLQPIADQIQTILQSRFGEINHALQFYKEPSIRMPMAQYSLVIPMKKLSQQASE